MNCFLTIFNSSIGKKIIMAITGLILCLFVAVHMIGNLFFYSGPKGFETYSHQLHSHFVILAIIETLLALTACIHVFFAVILYFQNRKARPEGYMVTKSLLKSRGGQTIASRLMPYSGLLILIFLMDHLFAFTLTDRAAKGGLYQMLFQAFHNPVYVLFYLFSVVVVAFHVSHGLWSAFQTLGLNHPRYMPAIMRASLVFAIITGMTFSSIPIFIFMG